LVSATSPAGNDKWWHRVPTAAVAKGRDASRLIYTVYAYIYIYITIRSHEYIVIYIHILYRRHQHCYHCSWRVSRYGALGAT
jgi:hypothetical protein